MNPKIHLIFFKEDGTRIASFQNPRPWMAHKDRCKFAEEQGLTDWHHYAIENIWSKDIIGSGYKKDWKDGDMEWCPVGLDGKLLTKLQVIIRNFINTPPYPIKSGLWKEGQKWNEIEENMDLKCEDCKFYIPLEYSNMPMPPPGEEMSSDIIGECNNALVPFSIAVNYATLCHGKYHVKGQHHLRQVRPRQVDSRGMDFYILDHLKFMMPNVDSFFKEAFSDERHLPICEYCKKEIKDRQGSVLAENKNTMQLYCSEMCRIKAIGRL